MFDSIACPQCGRRLRVPQDFAGDSVRCPACAADFSLEAARPEPPWVLPAPDPLPSNSSPEVRERGTPARPPRAVRKSSRRTCLTVLLIVGFALGILGAGVGGIALLVVRFAQTRSAAASRLEDAEEEMEDVREAFRDRKPLVVENLSREVAPLFDVLGTTLGGADAGAIVGFFDTRRMSDEVAALDNSPVQTRQDRRRFASGLRQGMERRSPLFQWNATEIRHIKKLGDDDILVIARHKHPNNATLKMRWWLSRRSGMWKIYDFEDLDIGLRFSATMAALVAQGRGNLQEAVRGMKAVMEALQAVAVRHDAQEAERHLRQAEGVPLPRQIEAMRFLVLGLARMHQDRLKESLEALEQAHKIQPDMPLVDFLRGTACNRLGQWPKALEHLQGYRQLLGEDAEVCREEGEALRGLSRFDEAAKSYRKSLDFNPKDAEAFQGLLRSLGGDDNKDDVGPRFAKLDSLRENFDVMAEDCAEREFSQLLEPLVQVMRKSDPRYPPVDYYDALVKARTGHADMAAPLFQAALQRQPDEAKRREWARGFLKAMAAAGQHEAAYAVAPDAAEAFRFLTAEAMGRYQARELKQLVAAHRKKNPTDPLLHLYQAEVYVREERYALADKAFAAALVEPPADDVLKKFRPSRVLTRYRLGQALSAYRAIGPRDETFPQLAQLCLNDENFPLLQSLLDEHARNEPKSLDLLRFRYRSLIRQKKTAEAVALFKAALAKRLADDKRREIVNEFLREMVNAGEPLAAYRAAPDAADGFRQVAEQLQEDGLHEDLRRLVEAHRAGHADDPWLALYQGEIHQHDKAWDKAAQVLKDGMKRAPDDLRANLRTNFVYAMFEAGRPLPAYAEAGAPAETFRQLAELMISAKKSADLEALIAAHRPHAGEDADLFYYEARARILAKRPAEAVPLFEKAYRLQKLDYRRTEYANRFLLEMREAGHMLEGYRAAPDKAAAFATLAAQLTMQKKDKELAALLQEYGASRGGDPQVELYTGELHWLRDDVAAAERHFASAVSRGDAKDQWRFRGGLFRARVKMGRAASTYAEFKSAPGIFTTLAFQCKQDENARQLQELLDLYRKDHADDPEASSWELDLLWLKHDYAGALKLLDERREEIFALPQFRWKTDEYRVRCLVKLKRTADAIAAAETVVKHRYGDRLLLILAHAASGDVPRTIAAMEPMKPEAFFLKRCYEDKELGSILRSEAFQSFRAKFLPPREEMPESKAKGEKAN